MPTFTAHTAIGQREDLIDVIYDISPTETPIMSTLARTKATAVFHEWQTDSLASATSANAAVEGADGVSATISPTTRLGNYTQIVQKVVQTSGTLEAVNKAGRRSERAYQLAKASSELKRDMETIITANQGRDAGSSS
ncbi:MAG: SU10 major capsid protein, partial [Rhodoluna sp.]